MNDYDNTNSGALFKNDKKLSDNHPDYKGSINVSGVEYWVSSWIKTSKAGTKFMSLSVQPKEAQQAPKPAPARTAPKPVAAAGGFADMDCDIPFVSASMHYDMTTSKARKLARYDY